MNMSNYKRTAANIGLALLGLDRKALNNST